MIVSLSPSEWHTACLVGQKRHRLRLSRGAEKGADARIGNRTHANEIGAIGEYALAKYYGGDLFSDWLANRAFVEGGDHKNIPCDLGRNVQVRTTDIKHGGLVLQAYDDERFAYVLGIVDAPARSVTFAGWQLGDFVKRPEFWKADWVKPAYLYQRSLLLPMDTLPPENL